MKSKGNKHNVRLVILESRIAFFIRHILMISLGVSYSLPVCAVTEPVSDSTGSHSPVKVIKFNKAFMHGPSIDISRFAQGNPAPAGEYKVQVAVNEQRRGKFDVVFKTVEGRTGAQPCFTYADLNTLGIRVTSNNVKAEKADGQCLTMDKWVANARVNYIAGDFYLDITVPQVNLVQRPRGYIDPGLWDSGVTAAIFDYNANVYAQRNSVTDTSGSSASGNLGLMAGLNFADWRFRKRMTTNWSQGNSLQMQSLLTYLQRDIPVLKSQLTLGDSSTSGDLFDSMTVRGIQLQSDDRMLPDGLRYYSPLIRGISETNAKVQVTQRGRVLYETTVPAGPFELNDIGAMGYGGDLQVTISEADGRKRTQVVPFSAPPMLLRDGVSRFSFTVGKVRDDSLREKPSLAQAFYQYGLGNYYTLYGGGQISENYTAVGIGNAFNTPSGGISVDVTQAQSRLNDRRSSGTSFNVSYSKLLDSTGTDVTLAGWRYSSKGFYSLRDAVLERYGSKNDNYIVDYRTRQRFTLSAGQSLWNGARLTVSGSLYNYWNDRPSARQYTVSYNKSERYFSWALSASRAYNSTGKDVNSVLFSFSVPLGRSSITDKPLFNTLYSSLSHNNHGNSAMQINAIGSRGSQSELSYGLGAQGNKTSGDSPQTSAMGNVNYNSAFGQFGSTVSLGNRTSQLSLSANGSLVAHRGGITAGPRLGDSPFALVEAPGAEGAKMLNGYGSQIDANGFALVPSLTPYRENSVAINTRGLPETVDVLEGENTVVPRMGAAIKINVKTLVGAPIVLIVKDKNGNLLPIGSDITDERDNRLGIIGQGSMAFVRGWQADKENLYLKNALGQRLCTVYSSGAIASQMKNSKGAVSQAGVLCR